MTGAIMKNTKSESVGLILVGLVSVYWGFTTVLMKHALLYMSSTTYIVLRFVIAAALVLPVYADRIRRNMGRSLLLHGCVLGLLQLIPMEGTAIALQYTTAANSVFISQLSFVFVPLIQCLLIRRLPDRMLVSAIFFLLAGLAVFSDVGRDGLSAGSLICVSTALFNAINVLCVKRFSATDDAVCLGVLQIAFCALFSIPVWLVNPGTVQWCADSVSILFFTSVLGSAVAFVASVSGQARTVPVKVSFLGLLQPIFAMLGGAVLPDEFGRVEEITSNMVLGSAIILMTLALYLIKSKQIAK